VTRLHNTFAIHLPWANGGRLMFGCHRKTVRVTQDSTLTHRGQTVSPLGLQKAAGLTFSKVGVGVWDRNRGQRQSALPPSMVRPYFTSLSSSFNLSDLSNPFPVGLFACQRELARFIDPLLTTLETTIYSVSLVNKASNAKKGPSSKVPLLELILQDTICSLKAVSHTIQEESR